MCRGLLLMIAISNVTGFNIKVTPVKHFTNEDSLFGQTVIPSKNGFLVPSPTSGKLFECTFQADECSELFSDDEIPKGLRPVASVASLTPEVEHFVMCNQARMYRKKTEYLDGTCKLMSDLKKSKLIPVDLIKNSNSSSNNNNNNNNQGLEIDQVKQRSRREAQPERDTKTDEIKEDDDAGTEIAFVLDGSGSIKPDDFQRAKDFIYNVMFSVWKTCFNCDFGIVQYGSRIRTELSLLDSKDHDRALQKVKEIQQIYNLTKTASAINHVLTDIFIPENGSKSNSKKIIIVLSDGQILGDDMTLDDVLSKPQMKDVTRYAIGVGEAILSKPEAIAEMKQIADPDKFFPVNNYAALDGIVSSLKKCLIGDAGTEIAFVLDGSGSINSKDFQKAKDFISNVMSNVWKICCNCDFGIVQYGDRIRTELSLLESKDRARALQKVKEIQQIGKITITASAINHVLTDIFVPENGSKNNAKKTIIVLSDGLMIGDNMTLDDVLSKPQMKDVTRYAIGVGKAILSQPEAIREMKEIADPDKFFPVSDYAALDGILSSLEKSLLGETEALQPSGSALQSADTKQTENENLNSNNNNNNHYRGGRLNEVKRRRRRNSQQGSGTQDEDEDDVGTEIAFVLDGSGSIKADDFQRAKGFISNVMSNVWNACFDCDFGIVQYGERIRTELSIRDSKNGERALQKVQEIKQIYNLTKTASAINHVLHETHMKRIMPRKMIGFPKMNKGLTSLVLLYDTDIFIPENGSNVNSKKIIIVLSDGQILGDNMTLDYVLNKPQMKNVTRYAIGVGAGILSKPEAIAEMKQIADPDKFFPVSNYAALDGILSSLEKSLLGGIEGTQQGAGFQLQFAEAGFSSHLLHNEKKIEALYGAVGAYDWSGGVIVVSDDNTAKFLNDSKNGPKLSYLGYSVTSARLRSKTLYISGAPRYNLTGGVFIFDGTEKYVLQGDRVGSYFGSVLCALDTDIDGYTDHLLVGAPHFFKNGEEGKVLMYKLNEDRFESVPSELQQPGGEIFARFGAAIASIGDIDANRFTDVAVGAPLEKDSSGSVYIYNGFSDGLTFSQKISPSDLGMKLRHFGQSVSAAPTPSGKPQIAVGSQGSVLVFDTTPVMIIKPQITIKPVVIPHADQRTEPPSKITIDYSVCFNVMKGILKKPETQVIEYQIDLDFGANKKRLIVDGGGSLTNTFTLTPDEECTGKIKLKYVGCTDCYSPIKIKLSFSLVSEDTRILDEFSPKDVVNEIYFENDCKTTDCKPQITLNDSAMSKNLIIIGKTQSLDINFNFTNTGDRSFNTSLTLTYPATILSQKKIEGAICPVKNDNQIQCNLQHPVFRRNTQTSLSVSWQLIETPSEQKYVSSSEIIANLTSQNNGSELLDSKIYEFNVMYSLPIQLRGTSSPNRLRIEEGKKGENELIKFEFEFTGENKYEAIISVNISITKHTFNTDLTIQNVKPEGCAASKEEPYNINCTMKKLQKISVEANVLIHDVQEKSEKIIAEGRFSFDERVYSAERPERTYTVEVPITKLMVTSSKSHIIGGSIGGFLLLFIIIIILFKCGFFRRRHKVDQSDQPQSPTTD